MKNIRILWTDDEIDLLKPHVIFLQQKGYHIITATNGDDAIELVKENQFDLIFLDENMPGLSGLETLSEIKIISPGTPVIMITKNEEEDIMDEAIGSKIADYLIKPVNPKQILLSIKKNLDNKRLITEKTTTAYQEKFGNIGTYINTASEFEDWQKIYNDLVYWELEFENASDNTMLEVLKFQKDEANKEFCKYIKSNYVTWFQEKSKTKPLLSHDIFKSVVFPLAEKTKTVVLVIDNFRFDQWKTIYPVIQDYYTIDKEEVFCSILPTATHYSRNAMFSGLMPGIIKEQYPKLWSSEETDEGKNLCEEELLEIQIKRLGKKIKFTYEKISNMKSSEEVVKNISNLISKDLCVLVYNFVDLLSHARTEMDMIKELTNDEFAFRSLTRSWFIHSPLFELIKRLYLKRIKIVITTDHGTIKVNNPLKVVGDRNTSTNLRYKQGKSLNYNPKEVFEVKRPETIFLPKEHVSSSYIFATNNDFLLFPKNYNHYANHFKNTFQHGGISMEEMLIPLITLSPK